MADPEGSHPGSSAASTTPSRVEVGETLAPQQLDAVTALVAAATETDGLHPLSEHVVLHLPLTVPGGDRHVLAWAPSGQLAGYAHLDPTDVVDGASGEVVVHPGFRGHGIGRLLIEKLQEHSPDGRLRLWAHGEHPGAKALAVTLGYVNTRELWQLRRSLRNQLPELPVPQGYLLRTFRPGVDDHAWVKLNAAAFAEHPEQGSWTLDDLHHRMAEAWFDPAGFFLLESTTGELAGFHWTKLHVHDTAAAGGSTDADGLSGHQPIGEVYVVGVSPQHRGRHLGSVLTVIGLRHLRAQGLCQAMLYVDADNTAAVHTYEKLGFSRWDRDVQYSTGRSRSTGSLMTPSAV